MIKDRLFSMVGRPEMGCILFSPVNAIYASEQEKKESSSEFVTVIKEMFILKFYTEIKF